MPTALSLTPVGDFPFLLDAPRFPRDVCQPGITEGDPPKKVVGRRRQPDPRAQIAKTLRDEISLDVWAERRHRMRGRIQMLEEHGVRELSVQRRREASVRTECEAGRQDFRYKRLQYILMAHAAWPQ